MGRKPLLVGRISWERWGGGTGRSDAITANHERGDEEHIVWGTRGQWCSGLPPLMMCWAEGSDPVLELVTVTKVIYLGKLVIFHPFYYMQTSASICIFPPLFSPSMSGMLFLPPLTNQVSLTYLGGSVEVPMHLFVCPDLQYWLNPSKLS